MKKTLPVVIIALGVALVLQLYSGSKGKTLIPLLTPTPLTSINSSTLVTATAEPTTYSSGIRGRLTIGPVCPVEKNPPDPSCAPRPLKTEVDIFDASGSVISKTTTDDDGYFILPLNPGSYTIKPVVSGAMPRCGTKIVQVTSGNTTEVDIVCDSGIR